MANNPYAGAVPLNLRPEETSEVVAKSTSYRPGEVHPMTYRHPAQNPSLGREDGNTPLRRYPNGLLDVGYVASFIIEVIHKAELGGNLTNFEKALLTLILPGHFQLIDAQIAASFAHLTDEEKLLLSVKVMRHFNEELNYNAGAGGGSVPFRHVTKS